MDKRAPKEKRTDRVQQETTKNRERSKAPKGDANKKDREIVVARRAEEHTRVSTCSVWPSSDLTSIFRSCTALFLRVFQHPVDVGKRASLNGQCDDLRGGAGVLKCQQMREDTAFFIPSACTQSQIHANPLTSGSSYGWFCFTNAVSSFIKDLHARGRFDV